MSIRFTASLTLALLFSLAPALHAVSLEESRVAAGKLERISMGAMTSGEQIALTESEVNSFLQYDYAGLIPEAIRGLQVQFQSDVATISGRADFSQFSDSQDPMLRLLLSMLQGEREFVARVRYVSSGGLARANIDSLILGGNELKGPILDWIVKNYVATDLAGFALGQPTPLGNNLEQIRLEVGRAVVIARDLQAQR